jgi:hypothetical protein
VPVQVYSLFHNKREQTGQSSACSSKEVSGARAEREVSPVERFPARPDGQDQITRSVEVISGSGGFDKMFYR